jgi:hypothetical protein
MVLKQEQGGQSLTHYGSKKGECGAETGAMTMAPSAVTCSICRGWLPIVAPQPQERLTPDEVRKAALDRLRYNDPFQRLQPQSKQYEEA